MWPRVEHKKNREEQRQTEASSLPHYVVIGLSHLSHVYRTVLQLLDGLSGQSHVVPCIIRAAAL